MKWLNFWTNFQKLVQCAALQGGYRVFAVLTVAVRDELKYFLSGQSARSFSPKVFKSRLYSNFSGWNYSEVPNRRADQNKRADLEKKWHPACLLLSKLINKQGGIFCLLHEKLRAGWKENLKNLSERALLLGNSE